jgi:hypothetical protein
MLKTIESFNQSFNHATQMLGLGGITKSGWLTHIDFFFQNTVKKSILNIKPDEDATHL